MMNMMKKSETLPATPARAGFQFHLWWFIAFLVIALPLWTVIQAWSMLIPPSDCNQRGDTTKTGAVEQFCLPSLSLNYGQGNMTIGPDGNLWFAEMNKIGRITPTGKLTEFPAHPGPIISGPDGNLWFVGSDSQGNVALVRMSPNGNSEEFRNSWIMGGQPTPFTVGSDGNLWAAGGTDSGGDVGPTYHTILKITLAGDITSFPLPPPSQTLREALPGLGIMDLTTGADGNIWFLENVSLDKSSTMQAMLLGSITPSGTIKQIPVEIERGSVPSSSQWDSLRGAIAAGSDGNLWFLQHDGQIGRVTPSRVITRFQVPGQTAQELPILTKGPDGNLWFSASPGKIGRITPDGIGKLLPLPAQTQVGALAAAPDGHLWFLNAAENRAGSIWWTHIGRLTV